MKRLFLFFLIVNFTVLQAFAQKPDSTGKYRLPVVIKGKDTLPVYVFEETKVAQKMTAEEVKKQKEWNRMVYDVSKVYGYATQCANQLKSLDSQMAVMEKRKDRNKYMKQQEERLKEEYTEKLKQLTLRQGKLLSKLISRQTGRTSYALIKDYKSGVTAFFWQSFASAYGMSLKDAYDPNEEPQIEAVLRYLGYK